ncbi:MAG TPA: hypothetical protein VKZ75_02945 [Cyclobacteriaceae bacterium]|nr:hypothetical protein [Cyclobacteriaceae bacterium]
MKIPSLFSKTPKHRRFNFAPRFYDEEEYERREREERIRLELKRREEAENKGEEEITDPEFYGHRTRIAGSFKSSSRRSITRQSNTSTVMIRFILFIFLTVWVIAYLQYGNIAFYGLLLIIPIYMFMRGGSRRTNRR